MKIKKTEIVEELLQFDHKFHQYINNENETVILDLPNANKIGGLVIQLIDNENIWIRTYHPYSSVSIDSIAELKLTIEKILTDQLIWFIGFDNRKWQETMLNYSNQKMNLTEGFEYIVLSWSGKLDKVIKI